MNARAEKRALREEHLALRDGLDPKMRRHSETIVADLLLASDLVSDCRTILLYASIGSEVGTGQLRRRAAEAGMTVLLPRMDEGSKNLSAAGDAPNLERGPMGIYQPAADAATVDPDRIDVVVVPGIAFDTRGYRLGHGAGYYDRFLARLTRTLRIGLTYPCLVVPCLPVEPHDQPVHWILTKEGLFAAAHRPKRQG